MWRAYRISEIVFIRALKCNKYSVNLEYSSYRGILADVTVYVFAHLHTALLAEGNMLVIN